jgi:hypothetical protein
MMTKVFAAISGLGLCLAFSACGNISKNVTAVCANVDNLQTELNKAVALQNSLAPNLSPEVAIAQALIKEGCANQTTVDAALSALQNAGH